MSIVVQKYGGTSVGSIDKIKSVAKGLAKRKEAGYDLVVVVSAMGKTTDDLIEMAKKISNNPSKRELDMLLSTGEQMTSALLAMALEDMGYDAIALTGFQAGIVTEDRHTKASILDIEIKKVRCHLKKGKIVIVAGFQGIDENGDITTLGRGGSDTTAVALAAKLGCPCEIYTDVEGIYGVDPRIYPNAKKLDYISYEEMLEMASLGAKVIETRAVELASKYQVPIYIALNTGLVTGTYIKELSESMESKVVTGLTASDDDLMVTINNVLYNTKDICYIFSRLAEMDINIDMISQTAPVHGYVNISFTAPKDGKDLVMKLIHELKMKMREIKVDIQEDVTKISVVGLGMRTQSGVAARLFKIFADNDIQFKQVTTSEIRISYTINTKDKEKAIYKIAEEFDM
ncbi:aspartate kinase [Clostridium sp. Cult3]|uniref:aspartate kinase n=1 Tax=Clostridium sp. Cult3 TaxID=2079004 RepID=UPI001F0242CD|nr:aspartate kinase [Clostridium sp. Cult3]MCF6460763.1 aspartate kinase [Clostridium sp. Cult3]